MAFIYECFLEQSKYCVSNHLRIANCIEMQLCLYVSVRLYLFVLAYNSVKVNRNVSECERNNAQNAQFQKDIDDIVNLLCYIASYIK